MNKIFESECNLHAHIRVEPSTQVDLEEGDVLSQDMFTDPDDEALVDLISLADTVTVQEIVGSNTYDLDVYITDDTAAVSLYQWYYANTNVKNDDDITMVCPGLNVILKGNAGVSSNYKDDEVVPIDPADAKVILDELAKDVAKTYADKNQFDDEYILDFYEDAINGHFHDSGEGDVTWVYEISKKLGFEYSEEDIQEDNNLMNKATEIMDNAVIAEVKKRGLDVSQFNESVSSKFAKYRKLYEAAHAELNEAEALNDDKDEDGGGDDDFSDIFGDTGSSDDNADNKEDDNSDNADDNGDDNKDENSDEDSENEDVPMTAVVLTVKKDDADKCKDEMVEAGIAEDDIEIIDSDDEDDENSKIKVDVNSVKELKDYLKGKGIDLEEKIGGEIVDDDEDSDSKDDEDKDDDSKEDDKKDKDGEGGEDDFADMDFGDLFGDDEESSDEK